MRYSSLAFVLICSVILPACHQTGVMGRGYSAYREPYKSAPGTKAAPIGYTYSRENNTAVLEAMRPAAQDLVAQMEGRIDPLVERIHLTAGAQTAFYSALDHVLREELTYRGYELATQPEQGAPSVSLSARQVKTAKGEPAPPPGLGRFDLTLSGGQGTLASGTYELPAYAFTGSAAPRISEQPDDSKNAQDPADDTSAPLSITGVTAEPLDEGRAVTDIPAQIQTTP